MNAVNEPDDKGFRKLLVWQRAHELVLFLRSPAEFTAAPLCLNDGLIAGPKEILCADNFHQTAALHHIARIVVDSCEHERAALFVESFIQAVNGFDACRIHQ